MPTKRQVLESLSRNELLALTDRHELEVEDRRMRERLIDAAAGSRKVALADALSGLSRDRLKELCRDMGLDDSGRDKGPLIERLTRTASKAKTSTPKDYVNGTNGAVKVDATEVHPGEHLTLDKLERYLWSAADILRGSIDSSDYKNYILGLLFVKRVSDRFDEECEALIEHGHEPEDKDEHQFFVPKKARWSELQKQATNVGEKLNVACSALEDANPVALQGVLAGIDFNDERRLGDAKNRDIVLGKLVQHFAKLSLKNADLSEPDMLGRAYEYLIERFADDAGKKGGEFYTPRKVVQLIVELLQPKEGMRICDPTCGSGGMLIECAKYVERHRGNAENLTLHGQEKNLGTWAICKMNMLLHGRFDVRVEKGDTIRDPKLLNGGALELYDRVIANPPFSLDEWGREFAEHDPFGRFRFGLPPKSKGDLAFVQHMVAVLSDRGRLGVVMPHGVLFRGSSEGEIRRRLVMEDLIEIVVGLPSNLFYGTNIPAALLLIRRTKEPSRRGTVMLIDASNSFQEGAAQNHLRDSDIQVIVSTCNAWRDVPSLAHVATIDEIKRNDFNLNITRYIEAAGTAGKVDLRASLTDLQEAENARLIADRHLNDLLRVLGYDRN